ncbi:MAG: CYTH domain-containing protein, partial [Ktedonobacteraceae bacterium]|nr:CYTH domain-containing protein [Ktedonobacteraceae bacterium]
TPDLALLRHRQTIFARLRDGHWLQLKFDEEQTVQHTACIEREFVLTEDGILPQEAQALFHQLLPTWQATPTWEEAKARNGLIELARIEKKRSVYTDGSLIMSIDMVKDLGNFVEIEMNLQEGEDSTTARRRVRAFADELGGHRIKAGYFEMWLYRYHQSAYQHVPARFRVQAGELFFPPVEDASDPYRTY